MRTLSRFGVSVALLVLAAAAPLDASTVTREHLRANTDFAYYSAIAVGADGVVHRVWREGATADESSVLMYARGGLGDWTTEVVDTREAVLTNDDIAVDAEGRVHLVYFWNNREDPEQPRFSIIYAVREAEGWVHTTLASPNVLSRLTLAIGPDGRPHVGWLEYVDENFVDGPAVVATFDGSSWQTVELPVHGTPMDLHVDPEGHAHVLVFGNGSPTRYLNDTRVDWAEEEMPEDMDLARLAVDGDGRVHVAGFLSGGCSSQQLRHLVREDGAWSVDGSFEDPGATHQRDLPFLLAGPDRQVRILYSEQRQETWDGDSDRWLDTFDGESWTLESFGTRADSAEINSCAVGPDGIVHVLCGGREAARIDYVRIGGPEFEVDTSALRVVSRGDGVVVKGKLRVRNLDMRRSGERTLRFARAERDEFRPGDAPLGRERRVRSLRPGARRSIPVTVAIPDPTPEERLLVLLEGAGTSGDGTAATALRLGR